MHKNLLILNCLTSQHQSWSASASLMSILVFLSRFLFRLYLIAMRTAYFENRMRLCMSELWSLICVRKNNMKTLILCLFIIAQVYFSLTSRPLPMRFFFSVPDTIISYCVISRFSFALCMCVCIPLCGNPEMGNILPPFV